MATLASESKTRSETLPVARDRGFLWLASLCAAIGIVGFMPTYWLQVPAGTFTGSPLLHLHALLFTGWLVLLVSQAVQVSRGRMTHHRAWGLFGISLASMMLVVGVMTAVVLMEARLARGEGDAARAFLILPLSSIGVFFAFVVAAIGNIPRPEWHKRFIIVATVSALQAAIARFFFLYANGMQPGLNPGSLPVRPVSGPLMGHLLLDLVLVVGMAIDRRRRGKVHPAWLWGLAVLVLVQLARAPISATAAWQSFADWLTRFT